LDSIGGGGIVVVVGVVVVVVVVVCGVSQFKSLRGIFNAQTGILCQISTLFLQFSVLSAMCFFVCLFVFFFFFVFFLFF